MILDRTNFEENNLSHGYQLWGRVVLEMRIGMLSPLEMRVPPAAYGGTELIVSLLTEGVRKRGHDVTLLLVEIL
jgi:hypothetical protein